MEPWRERLLAERNELNERLAKLNVFLANDELLVKLTNKHVALLIAQSGAMAHYLDILDRRLS